MAIKNSVSNDFLSMLVDSIDVFDCGLSSVKFVGFPIVSRSTLQIIGILILSICLSVYYPTMKLKGYSFGGVHASINPKPYCKYPLVRLNAFLV